MAAALAERRIPAARGRARRPRPIWLPEVDTPQRWVALLLAERRRPAGPAGTPTLMVDAILGCYISVCFLLAQNACGLSRPIRLVSLPDCSSLRASQCVVILAWMGAATPYAGGFVGVYVPDLAVWVSIVGRHCAQFLWQRRGREGGKLIMG